MREDRLDEEIRRLLQEASEEYDETSWELLSQRIDATDLDNIDDNVFDSQVKDTLERHTIPASQEHWEILNEELDQLEKRRRRVYGIKMLEALIFLLLAITYLNYTQFRSNVEIDNNYIAQLHESSSDVKTAQASLALPLVQKISTSQKATGFKVLAVNVAQISSIDGYAKLKTAFELARQKNIATALLKQQKEWILEANSTFALVPSLQINELAVGVNLPALESIPMMVDVEKEVDQSQGWSISAPLSYDVNLINNQLDLDYLTRQIESGLEGQSVGALIGYRKGYVEVVSGLMYSKKAFVPGNLTTYTKASNLSFLRNQLKSMNIHQMQIPLYAKVFAAPPQNKASLYALAGFSSNMIMHNQYLISRVPTETGASSKAPNVNIIDLQNLPRGVIQGGNIADNFYLTGMFGVGVQARISDQLKWYVQPTYRHALTGELNPLVDKISTLSVEAGVTYKL